MQILNEINGFLQKGLAAKVEESVKKALEDGLSPKDILDGGLVAGMNEVGEKFKNNEMFVPEILVAARAMYKGMAVLRPRLVEDGVEPKGTVVIGTVKGDLHDIGKNLVKMMMEGKGLKVVDLGVDVAPADYAKAAKEHGAEIIACSALLTTTMDEMRNVVTAVKDEGLSAKVLIGGAPVTESYRAVIGADGYASDAASAADLALSFCESA
jgi:methanogenic corrinoid protein MtbC1